MLIVLRFLGGLAIGGLLAPAWSLNIESMPAGKRATAVTIIMLGFSAGSAAAGQVTNFLAPGFGWEAVFWSAGIVTGLLAIVLQFTLPESARWMVAKGRPVAEVLPLLSRFDPGVGQAGYTELVLTDERITSANRPGPSRPNCSAARWPSSPGALVHLFLQLVRDLPQVGVRVLFMETLGIERTKAADLASINGWSERVGGVFLLMYTEKRGPIWIALAR
jgi:AAHS family 4-hydroxybenzoate transporter-like MFS transporter